MPRYSILLSSTSDPHRKRTQHVWAEDLNAAKVIARGQLRVMREVAWDRNHWNRWAVSVKPPPRFEPLTLAVGGPED